MKHSKEGSPSNAIYVYTYDPSMRAQTRFWFAIIYDDKNHGGGSTEKESVRRNHRAGDMEEESLRTKHAGIMEEESLRRNH